MRRHRRRSSWPGNRNRRCGGDGGVAGDAFVARLTPSQTAAMREALSYPRQRDASVDALAYGIVEAASEV
jgi:hypothetical protein